MVCEGNAVSPVDAQRTVACKYARAGQIVARTANGIRQTYEYDKKGQLLAVKDADGNAVERYAYDKAGNMLKKTVGGKTTTFTFDAANQLVSSTTDGVTTRYAYDAAGRLVKEGAKTYRYGYLDKVLSVTDGDTKRTFSYHADGQLASATVGSALRADRGATPLSETETFLWDGLALIQRGDEQFINESHVGNAPKKLRFEGKPRAQRSARRARKGPRGNPVASSKGTSYFNDMLGTTVGSKSNGKYSAAALSAFGEDLTVHSPTPTQNSNFFTGKPFVEGLGHAFLMRNYRAGLAKWQTADPIGCPDGWNQLAYCNNGVMISVDVFGAEIAKGGMSWNEREAMVIVGLAPGSTISHQIYIYEKKLVSDRFDVTIPYEGLDNGGVADIAVGYITGKWSLYNTLDNPDRDGMATSVGWSFLFINTGRTYFANYGSPEIWRSGDKRSVKYTYTFTVYTCEYVGADIPLPSGSISTGWQTDLPGLTKLGVFKVVLSHSIKE